MGQTQFTDQLSANDPYYPRPLGNYTDQQRMNWNFVTPMRQDPGNWFPAEFGNGRQYDFVDRPAPTIFHPPPSGPPRFVDAPRPVVMPPVAVPVPVAGYMRGTRRVPQPRLPEWEFPYHDPVFGVQYRLHQSDLDFRDAELRATVPDFWNPLDELYERLYSDKLAEVNGKAVDNTYAELGHPLPVRSTYREQYVPATVCISTDRDPNGVENLARWLS